MSIARDNIASEIALYDMNEGKLRGELIDMQHAVPFYKSIPPHIIGSSDVRVTAGSNLIVVASGARQNDGESRLSLVDRNIVIFQKLIPDLVQQSPDAIFLIVSNPVDIMTLVAYNISGLPRSRVLGSGTTLDSGRFRSYLAEEFKVGVNAIGGYVVGEHGDSSVSLLSSVTIGGIPYKRLLGPTSNLGALSGIQQRVRDSAKTVIKAKGYTNWGVGSCVGHIANAILMNTKTILPVSVSVKGLLPGLPETKGDNKGVDDDLYLSLPTLIDGSGASKILVPTLGVSNIEIEEMAALEVSANTLLGVIRSVKIPSRINVGIDNSFTYTAL
jgi:L-lactate dehydrogenase